MRIFLGFDDTDDKDAPIGTGRLVREFVGGLSDEYTVAGVVRHQLPRLDGIPYTSNNSSACAIIEVAGESTAHAIRNALDALTEAAVANLKERCAPGSDPGLCVVPEALVDSVLVDYARSVTSVRSSQAEAMQAAKSITLLGLGGTNDGIIGAAAAVGLTRFGWCGRFIEHGTLRALKTPMHIRDLNAAGIEAVSVDRDPAVPMPNDRLVGENWIRPSLWASKPVLQVRADSPGVWRTAHGKRKKQG